MPDTQIYSFFLDDPPDNRFLFQIKLDKAFRPKVGDSITDPITQAEFRVMRDVFSFGGEIRITDDGRVRVTDDGRVRVTGILVPASDVTHQYFVQPANNPQRISTWTRADFADNRTLNQLFNNRWS